ncbi:hypothetical protein GOBAR_DD11500 [Gossypium barbadense]|nr:hypothetical protein GOBAR_DD11500 [Gossypium barbadense]
MPKARQEIENWQSAVRETQLEDNVVPVLDNHREGKPSQLAAVDIFLITFDPLKEPPLVTAITVLSILAVDYPVDKVSRYVSDDGAAMLTFEELYETSEFARKWKMKTLKFELAGLLQRHRKFLEEGWIMQDGTPWPGTKHQRLSRNDLVGADDASTARVNGLHVHQCGIILLCSQKTANRKGGNKL